MEYSYCVKYSLPLDPNLNHLNPRHTLIYYLFTFNYNIILTRKQKSYLENANLFKLDTYGKTEPFNWSEIPCHIWIQKAHPLAHQSQSLVPILRRLNPVRTLKKFQTVIRSQKDLGLCGAKISTPESFWNENSHFHPALDSSPGCHELSYEHANNFCWGMFCLCYVDGFATELYAQAL